jgi:hypothetical protein
MYLTWIAIIASSLTGIGALLIFITATLKWIRERRSLLELTSKRESPWAQALLRVTGLGCVAIAGTGRAGTRERTDTAIGVIYAIIPAIFAFRKFHED